MTEPQKAKRRNCALLEWVATRDDLPPHLQGTLLRLVRLMDESGRINLSQAQIAERIRLSERQTRANIKELVTARALVRKRQGSVGGGRAADTLIAGIDKNQTGDALPVSCDNGDTTTVSQPSHLPSDIGDRATLPPISPVSVEEASQKPAEILPPIKATRARAEPPTNKLTTLELYPEPLEPSLDVAAASASAGANEVAYALLPATSDKPPPPIAARVCDAVGSHFLNPNLSPDLNTSAAILERLAAAGADYDLDILPTVTHMMRNKRAHVRSWGYFTDAIREATAKRLAAEAQIEPILPMEFSHDQRSHAAQRQSAQRSGGRRTGGATSVAFELVEQLSQRRGG